jgi:hypothetical protein
MPKTAAPPQPKSLSPLQEKRLRTHWRKICCGEPWVDDQFTTQLHRAADGGAQTIRLHHPRGYPPGGRQTAMRWCRACGRYTPPNAINLVELSHQRGGTVIAATLTCDDCHCDRDSHLLRQIHEAGILTGRETIGSVVRYDAI